MKSKTEQTRKIQTIEVLQRKVENIENALNCIRLQQAKNYLLDFTQQKVILAVAATFFIAGVAHEEPRGTLAAMCWGTIGWMLPSRGVSPDDSLPASVKDIADEYGFTSCELGILILEEEKSNLTSNILRQIQQRPAQSTFLMGLFSPHSTSPMRTAQVQNNQSVTKDVAEEVYSFLDQSVQWW